MLSKKIKKSISSLLTAFMLCNVGYLGLGAVSPTIGWATARDDRGGGNNSSGNDKSIKNQQMAAAIMGVLGVGIPLSGTVKYTYMTNDPRGNFAVIPVCTGTTSPTVDETASYRCVISDGKNYGLAQGSAKVSGGSQTIVAPGSYKYSYVDKNGEKVEGTANIVVNFMINGYEGKTTVGSSAPYGMFDTSPTNTNNGGLKSGPDNSEPNDSKGGGSVCPDGSYYCTADNTPNLTDGTNPDDGLYGGSGTNSSNPSGSSSGIDYGDLVDDLLNDNNSYNSGNNDWASSNGDTDGTGNLDDYFNGLGDESSESLPDYLTDDILGVDADLLGMEAVDTDGDGVADSVQLGNGETVSPDEYMAARADDSDSYYGYDPSSSYEGDTYNGGFSLQDLLNSVDSLGDSSNGDDSLNGLADNNSLADRIKNLINEKTDTSSGNGDQGMTEQQLFDMAKKLLVANGMTLEDIQSGKNYDKNSAYTEPANAWDMNRITTLLKAKKIKLEGSDTIRPEKDKKSLTSTANKGKNITDSKKAADTGKI